MPIRLLLSLILLLVVPLGRPDTGFAHALWIERTEDGLVLLLGHRHSDHGGTELLEYPLEYVVEAVCFDPGGAPDLFEPTAAPVRFPDECAACTALLSSGYWTKTPRGTKNVPKDETDTPLRSWLSFESVKRIDRWSEAFAGPLGESLEIVPLADPTRARQGDKITVLVTFRGEPLSGVPVSYAGSTRGETDAEGRVNIRLRHAGLQVLRASHRIPLESAQADEEVHTATFVFELEQEP
jgi:nickel transport protein